MKKSIKLVVTCPIIFFALLLSLPLKSQVNINVNLDVKHVMGDVESFDRQKFVNFHGTIDESGWNKENKIDDLMGDFLGELDVHVGRNTGGISWPLRNTITEDPNRPGYADPASIASNGKTSRENYAAKTWAHKYEYLSNQILCTQIHPFYPNGKTTNKGWAFSQTDTEEEPLGTASGEFLARFIQEYYGTGGTTGHPKPTYVEVTNEPLWDLVTIADEPEDLTDVFRFHSTVAKEVHKLHPDINVGGYCAAFPDFDSDNFQRWNDRFKHFIDVAGEDMDFWTLHLYDKPCRRGLQRYRKGSNVEATMDMLEQYSWMTLGEVKPLMISEYNATTGFCDEISESHSDWLKSKSTLSLMMQFMERADKICYAIPFFMLKYNAPLMRQTSTGEYEYSEKIKIYQILKDINGTRIDTYSNNPDIMVDAYVEGSKAYVIINSLDFVQHELNLNLEGIAADANSVEIRHLYLGGTTNQDPPKLDIDTYSTLPEDLTLAAEGTMVLVFNYASDIVIDKLSDETKYYADTYLRQIWPNNPIAFNINNVDLADNGEAVLRIGVGRAHGKAVRPTVSINGKNIKVPTNHRGGSQTDRDNFFGVLEIPVSFEDLEENNEVVITYAEGGGYVSTVTMQVFNFSHDIRPEDTAVGRNKYETLKIFPNPVRDKFTVAMESDADTYDLSVYNLAGDTMMEYNELRGQQTLNVKGLQKGIYLVTVKGKDIKRMAKLVIE